MSGQAYSVKGDVRRGGELDARISARDDRVPAAAGRDSARLSRSAVAGLAFWVVAFGARAAGSWFGYRAHLEPDTWLYVDAEPWFYPSPLGRLVGLGGVEALAALNVAGSAGCAAAVYLAARRWGANPHVGLTVLWFSPAALYVQQAGVDAAAACLVVWAVSARSSVPAIVAAGLHPASVLGWLPWRVWRGGRAAWLTSAVAGAIVAGAALLTPYAGIVTGVGVSLVWFSALTAGIGLLAFALGRLVGVELVAGGRGASHAVYVVGALTAGLQGHVQVRYLLPGTLLLAARARRGDRARLAELRRRVRRELGRG